MREIRVGFAILFGIGVVLFFAVNFYLYFLLALFVAHIGFVFYKIKKANFARDKIKLVTSSIGFVALLIILIAKACFNK